MNTTLIFLMPLIMALSNGNPIIDKENCTCNGIKLYGRVEVVDVNEDLRVRVVPTSSDIAVEQISFSRLECGYWEFVNVNPDFKIRMVEVNEDLRIEYVNVSPGMR